MKKPKRKRSPQTEVRTQRAIINSQASTIDALRQDVAHFRGIADIYRARATKAEQEAAEWKRRFDALLARDEKAKEAT